MIDQTAVDLEPHFFMSSSILILIPLELVAARVSEHHVDFPLFTVTGLKAQYNCRDLARLGLT